MKKARFKIGVQIMLNNFNWLPDCPIIKIVQQMFAL